MLILAMSLSGSAVFAAILLSAILGKRVLSSAWVYNMLRIDLVFFCLPLPIYNSEYKHIVSDIIGISRQWNGIDFATKNIIGIEESGRFHLNFQAYIITIWAVWTCGMLFILLYLYLYVLSIYCEQSCDAILVQNLDKPERKKYGELIIKMSMEEESGGW
ncbi:MAG: hypothetical protein HDR06_11885, partial [Lachnospiraceae bacterium]|nr:hypothetical protein [Lachnospiraceae bacterium]